MKKKELKEILTLHQRWLGTDPDGKRASLGGVDLRGYNLQGANLIEANLRRSNLEGANLRRSNLEGANLWRANLRGANLFKADLRKADLKDTQLPNFQIPQHGTLTVWKKVGGKLIKLIIPAKAKRTASLIGRQCRAEYVKVLWIEGGEPVRSNHDSNIVYKVGEIVKPDSYCDDIRVECTNGIHFWQTKEEAIEM